VNSSKAGINRCVLSFLLLLNLLAAGVEAQQPGKLRRIGLLSPGAPPPPASPTPFDKGLRQLGYVEGQNIAIERRYASGQMNRLPELAADLVRLFVDVICGLVPSSSRC
jgi:putative ABC transport system substrate-binding protein